MSDKPTLLALSSPGGHWIQLTRVCEGLEDRYRIVYVTPSSLFQSGIGQKAAASAEEGRILYSITDVSADDVWRLIPCGLKILYILLKERPQAILSTSAAPGAMAIWLGKLLRIKTIWLDSSTETSNKSRGQGALL